MVPRRTLAVLALAAPLLAPALEPRFDHRDAHGPFAEAVLARDTVARAGAGSRSSWRPAARVGWALDPLGEGNELRLGAAVALRAPDDPEGERVLVAADARYRVFFGTEALKTFFDLGLWAPLRSRLAVGPLVALGVAYDLSAAGGFYVSGGFATAFGEARIASFDVALGAQLLFDLP